MATISTGADMSARCSADPVEIRLFGSIAVGHAGRTLGPRDFGGRRPKQVLEILLAARGRPVPVDRLAELLWGERLPDNFAASIQTFISTLRRQSVRRPELCPRACRDRAGGVSVRRRAGDDRHRPLRRAAGARRTRRDRRRPTVADRRPRARSSRGPRRRAVRRVGPGTARYLSGPRYRRQPGGRRRGADCT